MQAKGNLPPSLVETSKYGGVCAGEDGCAGRRNVGSPGEGDGLAGLDTDGDFRLELGHDHAVVAVGCPAVQDGIFVLVVDELGRPFAVVADPDGTVVALLVLSDLALELVGDFLDTIHDVTDSLVDGVAYIAENVANGVANGVAGRGCAG